MRTRQVLASALFAAAATLTTINPGHTGEPAYVGTWAFDLTQCKAGQDTQGAPLVLSANGYDQHETHCTFKSANGKENEWTVSADCTVEGSPQPYDFKLTVSGDTLTVADDTGSRDLLKCK